MVYRLMRLAWLLIFFFQAEDGIRDLVRSRGLGDVYKRQDRYDQYPRKCRRSLDSRLLVVTLSDAFPWQTPEAVSYTHLTLADERSSVDLGGRRIITKKIKKKREKIQ